MSCVVVESLSAAYVRFYDCGGVMLNGALDGMFVMERGSFSMTERRPAIELAGRLVVVAYGQSSKCPLRYAGAVAGHMRSYHLPSANSAWF